MNNMVRIVEVDGRTRYFNQDCIESYEPKEHEVVLKNGHVLVIDPEKSDVDALTCNDVTAEIADNFYMKQFIVNVSALVDGREPCILEQSGSCDVDAICSKAWHDLTDAFGKKDKKSEKDASK